MTEQAMTPSGARAAAEELKALPWIHAEHCEDRDICHNDCGMHPDWNRLGEIVADAVAQVVKERDEEFKRVFTSAQDIWSAKDKEQAEEIARLLDSASQDDAYCLAHVHKNRVEEAICSLRFQRGRVAHTPTQSEIAVEQVEEIARQSEAIQELLTLAKMDKEAIEAAVAAERGRCAKAVCEGCEEGWDITESGLHVIPAEERPDESTWYTGCRASEILCPTPAPTG